MDSFSPTFKTGNIHDPFFVIQVYDENGQPIKDKKGKIMTFGAGASHPFVTEVTIVQNEGAMATITVNFEAPFEEGRDLLNSKLFYIKNIAYVRLGYGSGWTTGAWIGSMVKGGMGLSLTDAGLSGSITLLPFSASGTYNADKKWEGKTQYQTIQTICQEMGVAVQFSPEAVKSFNNLKPWTIPRIYTNMQLLQYMCDLAACRFYFGTGEDMKTSTCFIESILEDKKAVRKFLMRGQLSLREKQYPLLAFAPEMKEVHFTMIGGADSVTGSCIDDKGNINSITKVKPKPSGDGDSVRGATEKTALIKGTAVKVDSKIATAEKRIQLNPRDTVEGNKKKIDAALKAGNIFLKATLTTIGIPDLTPGEFVEVHGCGALMDGKYRIKQVTHKCGNGNYETSMQGERTGGLQVKENKQVKNIVFD